MLDKEENAKAVDELKMIDELINHDDADAKAYKHFNSAIENKLKDILNRDNPFWY